MAKVMGAVAKVPSLRITNMEIRNLLAANTAVADIPATSTIKLFVF
jgi:hypothetical protein